MGTTKFVFYKIYSRLLTPQQHYDWGLRALKTVLKGCGNMLKMDKKEKKVRNIETHHFPLYNDSSDGLGTSPA